MILQRLCVPVLLFAFSAVLPGQVEWLSVHPGRPVAPGPHGAAALEIEPNMAAIRRGVQEFQFQLPGGRTVVLERSALEQRGQGDVLWLGKVLAEPGSEVALTVRRGVLAGTVVSAGETYEIRPERARHVVERLDPSTFPPCGGGIPVPGQPLKASARTALAPDASATATSEVHLLSMYTPQARDAAGGAANIEAQIQQAVDRANLAFANSMVNARYTLVHTALAGRDDSGDMSSDLAWLQSDPATASLRNTYGADMVSLIVSNGGSACGIGYVMRSPGPGFAAYAFQVTDRDCAVGNLTFAHEHGHNAGMEHDPANGATPDDASYPWSFGHFVNGVFRTVMSYSSPCSNGCTRVAHYSNPSVYYNGYPTGIPDQRDNARTANLTMPIVAEFRSPAATVPPAAPTGLSAGAISSSRVDLAWADNADNETQTKIERSTDGSNFTQIATVGANVTSYSDTAVAASTQYWYRVRASNGAGDSAFSNVASVITPAAAPAPPAAPTNLAASAVYSGAGKNKTLLYVNLSFQDNSGDETQFRFERCKQTGKGASATCSFAFLANVGANTTTYQDAAGDSGTFKYRVRAENSNGVSNWSNVAQVNVQ
jgi:hypothetical protein